MRRATWPLLVLALLLTALIALASGAVAIPARDLWPALLGAGDATTVAIVRQVRLPRLLLGILVGAALGTSGSTLQATLRNGLAEPYLLGVSGGAAVGAVLAVAAGAIATGVVALSAFGGALLAVTGVLALAQAAGGRGDPRLLLMAGVVVGAFANAAIMVALATASPDTTRSALWWMMGSVAAAGWSDLAWLAGTLLVVGGVLVHRARELDILALGPETADSLGVDADRAARRFFLLASLLAAASVAAAGLVGFVGLMVPHAARRLVGTRHRTILVAAAFLGAILVLGADVAARLARPPAELPLGAVTALIGVPFFLVQLRRLA
jgi:iron complex transport system permease protein